MSTPPFKVKAVYEYQSPHEDDLHFPNGQIITVTENDEDDWYTGEYVDASGVKQEGIFPRNFVEKYEPTAPPRPARTARPKKEEAATPAEEVEEPAPVPVASKPAPKSEPEQPAAPREAVHSQPHSQVTSPPAATVQNTSEPPATIQSQSKLVSASKATPPPVSEKPSSFRDRIAAFNKPAAGAPPAPFKPTGLGSNSGGSGGFIKKPFVAPPPSREAYVPVVRAEAPQKIYRREEDPEIATQEAETQELAEKAGLAPSSGQGEDEDQPKPTSLKERIALLQKQQLEQAQRHADAAQKKEKPKKPVKKKGEASETSLMEEVEGAELQRETSQDTIGRHSIDSIRGNESATRAPLPRRRSSRGPSIDLGDGNDADMSGAGEDTEGPEELSTGRDDSDDKSRAIPPIPPTRSIAPPAHEPDVGEEEGAVEEPEPEPRGEEVEDEEEEEEDDVDPEVRRKEELRQRMAKMSGGMGMHGMFGAPMGMGMPAPAKKKAPPKQITEEEAQESSPVSRAPPVPMPGMSTAMKSPQQEANRQLEVERETEYAGLPITSTQEPLEVADIEDIKPAPPVPVGRPAPPPIPSDSRPTTSESNGPRSPGPGSESDDERSMISTPKLSIRTPATGLPDRSLPLRTPGAPPPPMPARPAEGGGSPRSPPALTKRASYFSSNGESNPTSPTTPGSKRMSRMPPIPGSIVPTEPPYTQTRAPPPPPPTGAPPALSRSSTGDARVLETPAHALPEESDEEVTEYEGDYDTDIASAVPHKEALKAHARGAASMDTFSTYVSPPMSPIGAPPLPPSVTAPRAIPPPPPPSQPPMPTRQSVDVPRAAPPPPPSVPASTNYGDDYDPYNYAPPPLPIHAVPAQRIQRQPTNESIYDASPPRAPAPIQPDRSAQSPRDLGAPPPAPSAGMSRQSQDIQRAPPSSRRSTDMTRMSMDTGFVAMDIDLARGSKWWLARDGLPPVFQGRKDILHESEETTSSKRGGVSVTTKDVYILFQDYSQTVITVSFDPQNPAEAKLEQRQQPPPSRLRQDQLEAAWEQFGRPLGNTVAKQKDMVVGDGTPAGLVSELLKAYSDALLPIGTRAYGALVYANLANASVNQHDEIRPGDIITLRNARLQGKHGPMHAKYSTDVGSGIGHVGVVQEWDGTKKKVRAWEQGRENRKVKSESYKLDDLRSGEVKIWRIMPRGWVGWEGSN